MEAVMEIAEDSITTGQIDWSSVFDANITNKNILFFEINQYLGQETSKRFRSN